MKLPSSIYVAAGNLATTATKRKLERSVANFCHFQFRFAGDFAHHVSRASDINMDRTVDSVRRGWEWGGGPLKSFSLQKVKNYNSLHFCQIVPRKRTSAGSAGSRYQGPTPLSQNQFFHPPQFAPPPQAEMVFSFSCVCFFQGLIFSLRPSSPFWPLFSVRFGSLTTIPDGQTPPPPHRPDSGRAADSDRTSDKVPGNLLVPFFLNRVQIYFSDSLKVC